MQELEKILEEIEEIGNIQFQSYTKPLIAVEDVIKIIHKHMNDGWIPVEKELPPNAKHKGAFCPKYRVMTKYGVTDGWYNPDSESWYVLIWFMTDRYLESEIDFDRGDKPKIVRLPDKVNNASHILNAWKPIKPYRPERSEEE